MCLRRAQLPSLIVTKAADPGWKASQTLGFKFDPLAAASQRELGVRCPLTGKLPTCI